MAVDDPQAAASDAAVTFNEITDNKMEFIDKKLMSSYLDDYAIDAAESDKLFMTMDPKNLGLPATALSVCLPSCHQPFDCSNAPQES